MVLLVSGSLIGMGPRLNKPDFGIKPGMDVGRPIKHSVGLAT